MEIHAGTIREVVKTIHFVPGIQDSGDLEPATKTITATAEAVGLANADYSVSLTLPKPDDARLVVKRVCTRFEVIRDSGTSTWTQMRVYVDVQDAAHMLFDNNIQDPTQNPASSAVHETYKPDIYNLLKDGGAHTFYFFLWVDSGDSVISKVQLWEAVGSPSTAFDGEPIMQLTHKGLVGVAAHASQREGSGTATTMLMPDGDATTYFNAILRTTNAEFGIGSFIGRNPVIAIKGTVGTDLNYVSRILFLLRSEK